MSLGGAEEGSSGEQTMGTRRYRRETQRTAAGRARRAHRKGELPRDTGAGTATVLPVGGVTSSAVRWKSEGMESVEGSVVCSPQPTIATAATPSQRGVVRTGDY